MGQAVKLLVFGATAIAISFFYPRWYPQTISDLNAIEMNVIETWATEIRYPEKPFSRLAVGVNGNVDLIVSGVDLLKQLKISPGSQYNHKRLTNLIDLQDTFSHFFSKGHAAERVFTNPDVFKEVLNAVFSMEKVDQYIGGNAALMAENAAILFPDVKVQFVGPAGPVLQKLMSKNISIPASSRVQQDEFHLIMEYKVGEKWGTAEAPVATRFICSYDISNSQVTMLETFFANLQAFKPDLVLLSGLHLLEGQAPDFFQARLDALATRLMTLDVSVPVHLELASMADRTFVRSLLEKVVPHVDSLGLNEQELTMTSIAMGGPHSQHLETHEGQPIIHVMSDLIHWILQTFGKSSHQPHSRLTRVHFHSLTYHIVGVHKSHWSNVKSATMAGTRIAGQQACDVKEMDPKLVDLRIPLEFQLYTGDEQRKFDSSTPAYSWTIEDFHFVFSPVLVCKHPLKTVGLGDAISATGLMFSHFSV